MIIERFGPVQANWVVQKFPALPAIWDLEKAVLHESHVSGTVEGPVSRQKSSTFRHKSQKTVVEANRVSDCLLSVVHNCLYF